MMTSRPTTPIGHGELLLRPTYGEWRAIAEETRQAASQWTTTIADLPLRVVRERARREAVISAADYSRRIGVPVADAGAEPSAELIAMTGRQPDLFHPGIWLKGFLLDRLARETGALAIDLVVDSDTFESIEAAVPGLGPGAARSAFPLVRATKGSYYADTAIPDPASVEKFCADTSRALTLLSAPSIAGNFERFCVALRSALIDADNLVDLITFARRRYEAEVGTTYLQLPVTALARTPQFARFVLDMALSARRFTSIYNEELAAFRTAHGIRSVAQPAPDLRVDGDTHELPVWILTAGVRRPARVRCTKAGIEVLADNELIDTLPFSPEAAIRGLMSMPLAPRALALTTYARVFLADLFVHGVGGGRYDQVTDGIVRRFYSIDPPKFAVASLSMYLPFGVQVVSDDEVATAANRLRRFKHHPDAMLHEVAFASREERDRAYELAREKTDIVAAISKDGADKARLGVRIREVNVELGEMLATFAQHLAREVEVSQERLTARQVLIDRTYPFCFWSPSEVADKAG